MDRCRGRCLRGLGSLPRSPKYGGCITRPRKRLSSAISNAPSIFSRACRTRMRASVSRCIWTDSRRCGAVEAGAETTPLNQRILVALDDLFRAAMRSGSGTLRSVERRLQSPSLRRCKRPSEIVSGVLEFFTSAVHDVVILDPGARLADRPEDIFAHTAHPRDALDFGIVQLWTAQDRQRHHPVRIAHQDRPHLARAFDRGLHSFGHRHLRQGAAASTPCRPRSPVPCRNRCRPCPPAAHRSPRRRHRPGDAPLDEEVAQLERHVTAGDELRQHSTGICASVASAASRISLSGSDDNSISKPSCSSGRGRNLALRGHQLDVGRHFAATEKIQERRTQPRFRHRPCQYGTRTSEKWEVGTSLLRTNEKILVIVAARSTHSAAMPASPSLRPRGR